MNDTDIATVGELIAALGQYDATAPIRLATQPGYPLENLLARVACTPDDAEYEGPTRTDPPVVWARRGHAGWVPARTRRKLLGVVVMTTTAPGITAALAERAMHAARAHRTADPDGFHHRTTTPTSGTAGHAVPVSPAPSPPPCRSVWTACSSPTTRAAPTAPAPGPVPGDLITVTDTATGRAWRFIPDFTSPGDGWLLLDRCAGGLRDGQQRPRHHRTDRPRLPARDGATRSDTASRRSTASAVNPVSEGAAVLVLTNELLGRTRGTR